MDERDRFEVAYVEASQRAFTVESVKALREDDHYGSGRHFLNGAWNGWQMARGYGAIAEILP